MINVGICLVRQTVGRIFIFTIGFWILAACHDGHIMYIVACQASLLRFYHIAIVNKNHSTSGPGPSVHFPSRGITQCRVGNAK